MTRDEAKRIENWDERFLCTKVPSTIPLICDVRLQYTQFFLLKSISLLTVL
jgi:hypothetical protein